MFDGALFDEYKNFTFKFPEPQYLVAKAKLLPWIARFLPDNVEIALDAFAGSQSVSYYFKQLGYKTITNDFLSFNNQIGKVLIENKQEKLDENDLRILFADAPNKADYTLMDDIFTGIFFQKEDDVFIDNFRANIEQLSNSYT